MTAALFPPNRPLDPTRIPGLDWLLALMGAVLAYLLWPGTPA